MVDTVSLGLSKGEILLTHVSSNAKVENKFPNPKFLQQNKSSVEGSGRLSSESAEATVSSISKVLISATKHYLSISDPYLSISDPYLSISDNYLCISDPYLSL